MVTATLIDGRALAARIKERLRREVGDLARVIPPIRLASIEVGDNAAAALFVRNQERAARELGIEFEHVHLPAGIDEAELIQAIKRGNDDPRVTGILVQRPLPPGMNVRRVQAKVHPDKDVEGLNPANMGFIVLGEPKLVPCTALASIKVLLSTGVDPRGKDIVVIGHSEIVGKPIAFLLINLFATVTVCHVATQDLAHHTSKADVVFVAVGKPGLVRGSMLRPGCTVIDIGINQVPLLDASGRVLKDEHGNDRTKVVGDVDFDSVVEVAGALTPVPGGVGPVTVATLLSNAVAAARLQHRDQVAPPDLSLTAY
ncbi:MAG: bifunctional 5,10-methylenetetrahydrofolate dehydrogenase/5,10-methenyltetrahydrofolate cyclohydrolase [Planctomycetes bacterium]|nr:bifunctional 5,10-methylenetetrahydrofolate dehydrogenase/5,10-methenyltetrahydrofolate cyclohydrolase [Planctomycetota bacterium]MCC7171808.1 bifunctional 5,10-methylenetetrahydrofolate dehydrogenase/5,10-methenyltetrahydrofolate cyclohydrolase [Planctomycetota bacterium]